MFRDIWNELVGTVPGLSSPLARTKTNEALRAIYESQFWSFQAQEGGWLTPGLLSAGGFGGALGNTGVGISPGTITTQPFQTLVTGDAAASAAWLLTLFTRPFLTEMQFRVPYYALYNIVAVDATNPAAVVLTLDRPWMEPAQQASPYMIYQAYFPAPQGFKKWQGVRDFTNNDDLDYWSLLQADINARDPERVYFNRPSHVVPYKTDTRPGSATAGQMLYELWPHPLSRLPYKWEALVLGPLFQAPGDTAPYPLSEELVKWRALEVCCWWAEAQKGVDQERGSGADWKFLAQEAHAQYELRLKDARQLDRNLADLYWTKFRRTRGHHGEPFSSVTGQLTVGSF